MNRFRLHCLMWACLLSLGLPLSAYGAHQIAISKLAAKAHSEGQVRITIATAHGQPAWEGSLEESSQHLAILLVRVSSKFSSIRDSGDSLWTWYRATIVENLNNWPLPAVKLPAKFQIPAALTPLAEDSLIIRNAGGEITTDGVHVHSPEDPASLSIGKEYIVLVEFLGFPDVGLTRISQPILGAASVYVYDSARDLIAPLPAANLNDPFVRDISTQLSLSHLRQYLSGLTRGTASRR